MGGYINPMSWQGAESTKVDGLQDTRTWCGRLDSARIDTRWIGSAVFRHSQHCIAQMRTPPAWIPRLNN